MAQSMSANCLTLFGISRLFPELKIRIDCDTLNAPVTGASYDDFSGQSEMDLHRRPHGAFS